MQGFILYLGNGKWKRLEGTGGEGNIKEKDNTFKKKKMSFKSIAFRNYLRNKPLYTHTTISLLPPVQWMLVGVMGLIS